MFADSAKIIINQERAETVMSVSVVKNMYQTAVRMAETAEKAETSFLSLMRE